MRITLIALALTLTACIPLQKDPDPQLSRWAREEWRALALEGQETVYVTAKKCIGLPGVTSDGGTATMYVPWPWYLDEEGARGVMRYELSKLSLGYRARACSHLGILMDIGIMLHDPFSEAYSWYWVVKGAKPARGR